MTYERLKERSDNHWENHTNGEVPLIRVGTALCGSASGAFRVISKIKSTLQKYGVKANIDEVGCLGICYAEPLMDITTAN